MLCHFHTVFHGFLPPNPNPNPNSPLPLPLLIPRTPPRCRRSFTSYLQPQQSNTTTATTSAQALHEAAETSRLSRRQNADIFNSRFQLAELNPNADEADDLLQLREEIVDEASLSSRRIPRFPGSVDFPGTERIDPHRCLDNDLELRRALELRRGVAAEALKDSLRAGRLSDKYSANLVSCLQEFVDRVVIGAAAMKAVPESSHLSFNARTKNYIRSSGVVAIVKWLKHNHLTFPQIGKVICNCSGDLEQVRCLCEWLKTIHVRCESLGVVLVKAGPIWERSTETLEEIVACLVRNGVRRDWVGFVVSRCPQVLRLTKEELESRVKFYLEMGMSEVEFGTMVFDYPRALGFFSLENMDSKVKYLKEFGLTSEEVGRLLAFKPQLMGCSIEEKWMPLVKYLYYLGVRRYGMKRILIVKPMIFCVDLETTIAPKVRFLQDIGIAEEAIGGVLVKFPHLLTYSLYQKIRPVVIFLMTKAGVSQRDIGKVIASDPQLVGCSIIDKLEVNVKYFLSLGIPLRALGEMIGDFPTLLRYNMDILRPKYRYLRRTMVCPLQHLIRFPRFFSYSLDGRIIPRHEILVANRVTFDLRTMLACSDEEFDRRIRASIQNRERFEMEAIDEGETTLGIDPVAY